MYVLVIRDSPQDIETTLGILRGKIIKCLWTCQKGWKKQGLHRFFKCDPQNTWHWLTRRAATTAKSEVQDVGGHCRTLRAEAAFQGIGSWSRATSVAIATATATTKGSQSPDATSVRSWTQECCCRKSQFSVYLFACRKQPKDMEFASAFCSFSESKAMASNWENQSHLRILSCKGIWKT